MRSNYLVVILICISLMANNVEYLYICVFSICTYSSVNYFMSFAHVKLDRLFFYC